LFNVQSIIIFYFTDAAALTNFLWLSKNFLGDLLTYLYTTDYWEDIHQLPYLDTGDLNHEHRCTKYMPSIVAPELDSSDLSLLVKVHRLNAVHAGLNVFLCVQHLIRGDVANFHIV